MNIRDLRQKEFAQIWLDSDRRKILNLCPRFGKIRTTINILNKYPSDITILIAYPDKEIEKAWKEEFKLLGYKNPNIIYTTHLSLKKHIDIIFDLVIIDEIHLLSDAQIDVLSSLILINKSVLGLTGTMTKETKTELKDRVGLNVVANYPIEQAISEGVITDYEITVIKVPLDNKVGTPTKKGMRTEKALFDTQTFLVNLFMRQGRSSMFPRLARMRIIQNSLAKQNKTKELLIKYKDERVLVFCGLTKIADSLGIPSYHSKSSEEQVFEDFAEGKGNHLAVVKIGNTGVTYTPLNRIIINYFDSNAENLAQRINRCMAMEYNTPDKKAHIYIISTNEPVELKWLTKALEFFDKNKIKYI